MFIVRTESGAEFVVNNGRITRYADSGMKIKQQNYIHVKSPEVGTYWSFGIPVDGEIHYVLTSNVTEVCQTE